MSRVLKTGNNQITQTYEQHCANVKAGKAWAQGVDVVKYKAQIDKVTAHSAGTVIKTVDYLGGTNGVVDAEGMGYGNYVMIQHDNNYVTVYAHLEATYVRVGQMVVQGDEVGLMGNTGNSFGAHLHFELRKYKAAPDGNLHDVNAYEWLDPTDYLDADLPAAQTAIEAGAKTELKNTPVFSTETGASIGTRSGTYYIWSDEVGNGRVRMTNSVERVGVSGQVSFWVNIADIGFAERGADAKTETTQENTPTVKVGAKCELKDTPVYNTESTVKSTGKRTGIYYIWSDEVKNGRVRMTNSPARVGVAGQVSFWVEVKTLK